MRGKTPWKKCLVNERELDQPDRKATEIQITIFLNGSEHLNTSNLEVDGLQEQNATLNSSFVSQEQKTEKKRQSLSEHQEPTPLSKSLRSCILYIGYLLVYM